MPGILSDTAPAPMTPRNPIRIIPDASAEKSKAVGSSAGQPDVQPSSSEFKVCSPSLSASADAGPSRVEVMKKKRAPKGSAGTFQGRRAPKDPKKLAKFLEEKKAWVEGRTERLRPRGEKRPATSAMKKKYADFLREFPVEPGVSSREWMKQAAVAWRDAKQRIVY